MERALLHLEDGANSNTSRSQGLRGSVCLSYSSKLEGTIGGSSGHKAGLLFARRWPRLPMVDDAASPAFSADEPDMDRRQAGVPLELA